MPVGDGQFWMRAYPRRWREARGEELLARAVDLAGPDARRLTARAAFELVRGGWVTRWREHPPLHTWLLYRTLDRRLPAKFRSWALDDIDGPWYPMRSYLSAVWWFAILLWALSRNDISPGFLMGWYLALSAVGTVLSMVMWPEQKRGRARTRHVAPRFGEVPVEGTLVAWPVPGKRSTARSALTWGALLLGIAAAASVAAALLAPRVIHLIWVPAGVGFDEVPVGGSWVVAVATLSVALGVGMVGGWVARRRLSRLLVQRPAQPYRVVRPVSMTGKANLLVWALLIGALAWLEVRTVLGLSMVLGAVALLLLPGALVALVVTRGEAPDLAGSDVWWIATRGRVPTVDRPAPELRPLSGPDAEAGLWQPHPWPGAVGPAQLW